MKTYTRGFTLIELLVVIAIIGILSSVVLVSLNSARNKGKDARVITSVQQVRISAESAYDGTNYSGALAASNSTASAGSGLNLSNAAVNALKLDTDNQGSILYAITNAGPTSYAIYGRLPSSDSAAYRYFCIDSTGSTSQSVSEANKAQTTCR